MKNKRNKKVLVLVALLFMLTIGYSALRTGLNINGIATIPNVNWDIHFVNVQVAEGSVDIGEGDSPATINPDDNKEVDYAIKLSQPDEYYEFTVDAKNFGTIDGMIESITSTLQINDGEVIVIDDDSDLPPYLNYSITYVDGSEIPLNHRLNAGEFETYKVRLEFKSDIDPGDLPDEAKTLKFSIKPVFVQAPKEETNQYRYGFFSNEDVQVLDYEISENCENSSFLDGYTAEEKAAFCRGEKVNDYGIDDYINDGDGYSLAVEGIIKILSANVPNSSTDFRDLNKENFIKYNSDLSDNYVCTMYNSSNGNPTCFKDNSFNQEKSKLIELFGEENCTIYDDSVSCRNDDADENDPERWQCTIEQNNYLGCEYDNSDDHSYTAAYITSEGIECE